MTLCGHPHPDLVSAIGLVGDVASTYKTEATLDIPALLNGDFCKLLLAAGRNSADPKAAAITRWCSTQLKVSRCGRLPAPALAHLMKFDMEARKGLTGRPCMGTDH